MAAPANAATMSPEYWWQVHRPNTRPRPFFGNQLPMMAVLTGPPVAWRYRRIGNDFFVKL